MKKIHKIIIIVLFFTGTGCFAAKESLSNSINKLVEHYLPNAFVGIVVKNCDDKIYYKKNADRYFTPASNTKIYTCTAAELFLGKDFKFTTAFKLYRSLISGGDLNGNLYIDFTGDPTYSTEDLKQNLLKLKNIGIKWVRGDIIIDDSIFSKPLYAQGIAYEDIFYAYGVPPRSIILDGNVLSLDIQGGQRGGDSAEIIQGEQNKYFNIKNNIVTVDNSNSSSYSDISVNIDNWNTVTLNGSISANYQITKKIPIKNSFKYVCDAIKSIMNRNGISFDKRIIIGNTPPNMDAVVVNASASLPDLIKYTLKESDNLYANSLLKNMGMQRKGVGTYSEGLMALNTCIEKLTGISSKEYKLCDGSGLSRYNLVTPNQVSELLVNIFNNNDLNQYILGGLPVSGVDGTLKNRMINIPLKGRIKAKTGTMSGVSALSGYVCFDKGRPVVFSIIINGILDPEDSNPGKNFENALCKLLYEYFKDVESRK